MVIPASRFPLRSALCFVYEYDTNAQHELFAGSESSINQIWRSFKECRRQLNIEFMNSEAVIAEAPETNPQLQPLEKPPHEAKPHVESAKPYVPSPS